MPDDGSQLPERQRTGFELMRGPAQSTVLVARAVAVWPPSSRGREAGAPSANRKRARRGCPTRRLRRVLREEDGRTTARRPAHSELRPGGTRTLLRRPGVDRDDDVPAVRPTPSGGGRLRLRGGGHVDHRPAGLFRRRPARRLRSRECWPGSRAVDGAPVGGGALADQSAHGQQPKESQARERMTPLTGAPAGSGHSVAGGGRSGSAPGLLLRLRARSVGHRGTAPAPVDHTARRLLPAHRPHQTADRPDRTRPPLPPQPCLQPSPSRRGGCPPPNAHRLGVLLGRLPPVRP